MRYPHVVAEIVRRAGCSQADAELAILAVGMDVERALGWLRRHADWLLAHPAEDAS